MREIVVVWGSHDGLPSILICGDGADPINDVVTLRGRRSPKEAVLRALVAWREMLAPCSNTRRHLMIIWQSLQQDVTSNSIFEAMPTWLEECSQ